jgi:hypothetical protein
VPCRWFRMRTAITVRHPRRCEQFRRAAKDIEMKTAGDPKIVATVVRRSYSSRNVCTSRYICVRFRSSIR